MQINWKLRFLNPTTALSLVALIVTFLFDAAEVCEIVPPISQEFVMQCVEMVVKVLAVLGVLVDPTTKGISDSDRAMTYEDLH